MNNITLRSALILGFVALICTGISIAVYQATRHQISDQIANQQLKLLDEVLSEKIENNSLQPENSNKVIFKKLYNNNLLESCYIPDSNKYPYIQQIYLAKDNSKLIAYAMRVIAPNGYNGDITLLIAATPQGKVLGVRTIEQHETPGLGDKILITKTNWIKDFTNKIVNPNNLKIWAVKKDGGMFDQFSGATITPRAVVNSVRNTVLTELKYFNKIDFTRLLHCK